MDDEQKKKELQEKYDAYRKLVGKQRSLKQDGQRVVDELGNAGVTITSDLNKIEGLGDLIHATLNKLGITEERFKQVLQLKECHCNARRKFLNKLIPFTKG
jgi:predicted flap endonuclease-1-like 5' DNA nuclease